MEGEAVLGLEDVVHSAEAVLDLIAKVPEDVHDLDQETMRENQQRVDQGHVPGLR